MPKSLFLLPRIKPFTMRLLTEALLPAVRTAAANNVSAAVGKPKPFKPLHPHRENPYLRAFPFALFAFIYINS